MSLVASLLLCASPADAEVRVELPTLSAVDRQRLEAGEVLARHGRADRGGAGLGWAAGLVHATPEQVFKVIADVGRYTEFMPRVVESRVLGTKGSRYRFYYRIDMPWPLSDYDCVTQNWHEEDRRRRIYSRKWMLLTGTFTYNEGSWTVFPWAGARALLVYSSKVLPKTAVPTRVVNYAVKIALPRAVEAVRHRVGAVLRMGKP